MTRKYPVICLLLLLTACSGGNDDESAAGKQQEHVWSGQTGTINKARNVENILDDAAARQRRQIDEQSQ